MTISIFIMFILCFFFRNEMSLAVLCDVWYATNCNDKHTGTTYRYLTEYRYNTDSSLVYKDRSG